MAMLDGHREIMQAVNKIFVGSGEVVTLSRCAGSLKAKAKREIVVADIDDMYAMLDQLERAGFSGNITIQARTVGAGVVVRLERYIGKGG